MALGEKARPVIPDLRAAVTKVDDSFEGIFARWSLVSALNQLTGANDPVIGETRPPPEKDPMKAKR